jgi:hypothetical protein
MSIKSGDNRDLTNSGDSFDKNSLILHLHFSRVSESL